MDVSTTPAIERIARVLAGQRISANADGDQESAGSAVDDLVIDLPRHRQPDALITAAESVPGVRVESVRPDPGVADAHREWELVEALTADPAKAVHTLATLLPQVLRVFDSRRFTVVE